MKLSIITVNLNDSAGLRKTMESVTSQSYTDYEYIVIDGGSTDGSVDVIRDYEHKVGHWRSEKDKGIYDAMNKGIKMANGDYLLMLNSGDCLADAAVLETAFQKVGNEDVGVFYGDIIMDDKGKLTPRSFPDELTFGFFLRGSLSHQATFIQRKLHDTIGLYSDHLKIAADWKFFVLAICKFNVSYQHIPVTITIYKMNGISSDPVNLAHLEDEQAVVKYEHFPAFWLDYHLADEQSRRLKYLTDTKFYKVYEMLASMKKKIKPGKQ